MQKSKERNKEKIPAQEKTSILTSYILPLTSKSLFFKKILNNRLVLEILFGL